MTKYKGKLCSVTNCENSAVNNGMCAKHELRRWRNGHTQLKIMPRGLNEKFYKRTNGNTTPEHRIRAEQALGHSLPKRAIVHHHENILVICPDQAYHMLLHKKLRDKAAAELVETWLRELIG